MFSLPDVLQNLSLQYLDTNTTVKLIKDKKISDLSNSEWYKRYKQYYDDLKARHNPSLEDWVYGELTSFDRYQQEYKKVSSFLQPVDFFIFKYNGRTYGTEKYTTNIESLIDAEKETKTPDQDLIEYYDIIRLNSLFSFSPGEFVIIYRKEHYKILTAIDNYHIEPNYDDFLPQGIKYSQMVNILNLEVPQFDEEEPGRFLFYEDLQNSIFTSESLEFGDMSLVTDTLDLNIGMGYDFTRWARHNFHKLQSRSLHFNHPDNFMEESPFFPPNVEKITSFSSDYNLYKP